MAALEGKVADREKSGGLGVCHTATLTSLSARTELVFFLQLALGGSPQRDWLGIRIDLPAALPFLHTHVCPSKAAQPLEKSNLVWPGESRLTERKKEAAESARPA